MKIESFLDFSATDLLSLPQGLWLDIETPGLALQVIRKGLASFVLINKDSQTWLGNAAVTPLGAARAMARRGVTVAPEKDVVTLRKCWADYQKCRRLKPTTMRHYNQRLNTHCVDWLDIPMSSITKDMVHEKFNSISAPAIANSTMRTVRALFHFAQHRYADTDGNPQVKSNPVHCLSETRSWNKDKRRTRVVHPQQLHAFVSAIFCLHSETAKDLLLLLLFTGMRVSEGRELKWENVNLQAGVIELPGQTTKTGEPYVIPLSDYAWSLLLRRRQSCLAESVFPNLAFTGPVTSIGKACQYVRDRSGVKFSPHDLRRSFVTFGDDLEIKHQTLKCLLNHKGGDETEMYIQPSLERLRRASQQICDYILRHAGIRRNTHG